MSRGYPFNCAASCPCRTVATDPNCLCGFTRCDQGSPYCEVTRLAARAVVSSKAEGGPGLSESDALLLAFDKMAEWHRAEAKRRAEGSRAAGTSPETPPVKPARKPRRTREEMKAHRAAVQERITKSYRELVGDGHWLDEPDKTLDSILKSEET